MHICNFLQDCNSKYGCVSICKVKHRHIHSQGKRVKKKNKGWLCLVRSNRTKNKKEREISALFCLTWLHSGDMCLHIVQEMWQQWFRAIKTIQNSCSNHEIKHMHPCLTNFKIFWLRTVASWLKKLYTTTLLNLMQNSAI